MIPVPFDPSAKIEWSPVWSLRDERFKYLPTSLLYFFYRGPGQISRGFQRLRGRQHARGSDRPGLPRAGGTGCLRNLVVQSIAAGRKWTSASSTIPTSAICRTQLAETGRRLWVLDVTSDLGIPSFVAISHWMENGRENIEFGSGAHFDPRIALLRALTELNQFLSHRSHGRRNGEKSSLDGTTPLRLQDHPYLTPSDNPIVQPDSRLEVRPSRHARAGDRLRAVSPSERASISSSSIRRAPTSTSRSSE